MNNEFRMGVMTDFSIGQSLLTIGRIVESVQKTGLKKIAVADDMTISSMIALQNTAKASGFEAMVGVKYRCYENPTYRKATGEAMKPNPYFTLKIFPKNKDGLKSIFKLLTLANSEERYYYNARGCIQDLENLEHCIVTSGDLFGIDTEEQFDSIKLGANCTFYMEFCPIDTPFWDKINGLRFGLTERHGLRTVISYPAMYQTDDQASSMKALKAVCTNTNIDAEYLPEQPVKNFALEASFSIEEATKTIFERLINSGVVYDIDVASAILESDDFENEPYYVFEKHDPCLPQMAEDEFDTLVKKCMAGWNTRLKEERLGYKPEPEKLHIYKERLAYELSVLRKMGFAGYFLVVEDLVNWSKNNGVRVGCGRGSGGGSLVAYLLGITEVDPIRFNLFFERFINPARLDLPDIDLDYQSSKRHCVIEYLRERYGEDRVAGISNYGTLASASAFRDTGRVFGLSPLDMSATKLVPKENGVSATLTEAAHLVPEIDKLKADYPEIWGHALRFEGVMRSLGQHAAGTVVAGEPLVNRAVVERRAEGNVVNWDKRVVEDFGLIKMDILGLSTLDVLDIAQQYIKERHGIDVDYLKLPLDDRNVLDAFGRGDTTAVFQFDSQGMQGLLKALAKNEPLTFEDVTAATALYRPGPLDSGLTEEYIAIKQGVRAPHYDHPNMKDALKETYGVMVYQEGVMQVARDLAGFTMAEADFLRKAIGKKDLKKMTEMRDKFIEGCYKTSGFPEMSASNLWDKIEKFAGYSFNKSHSVAYTILSYWTCWLKTYYPAEYFASQLSIVKEDKYSNLVMDARACGIEVVPPDVNFSGSKFGIRDDHHIVMPFSAIKGCSEKIANKIVNARIANGGKFSSKEEFAEIAKQKGSGINVRVVNNLDLVGAFAEIEPDQLPATDESRRKDQTVLMPGLIIDTVVSNRTIAMDEKKKLEILSIVNDFVGCENCNLCKSVHALPSVGGAKCKFMVVFDCPSGDEEKNGKMFVGSGATYLKKAFKTAGVSASQGYYTSLVKAKKNDKVLTNDQINGCSGYLDKEVEVVKPGVILAMGSASVKHFLPEVKSPSQEVGNSYYVKEIDASVIIGFNPMQIFFSSDKMLTLEKVAEKLAKILGNE